MQSNIIKVIIINFAQRFHLYIHAYALLLQGRGWTTCVLTSRQCESVATFPSLCAHKASPAQ